MMTADQLISGSIIPLQVSDNGDIAMEMMEEMHIRHLPVVSGKELMGIISEAELLDADPSEPISGYRQVLARPFVRWNDHITEVMRVLVQYGLTTIPVLDDEQSYLGAISQEDVFFHFSRISSITEPGSVIILEMNKRDYSLSQISRIAESEDVIILSSFVQTYPDTARMEVTLKLNRQNVQGLMAGFQRFNYEVKACFNTNDYEEGLRERYESLMAYLNV